MLWIWGLIKVVEYWASFRGGLSGKRWNWLV